jgi:suppressor for copper-sensitivity B
VPPAAVSLAGLMVGLLAPAPLAAAVGPWVVNPECRVRLISPYATAPAAGELRLGLHFRLAPGWHSYWKNSGSAGYPPELDFAATPELSGVRLLWPAPERFELPGDLVAFGYEDEVVYPLRAHLDAVGRDRLAISAVADYVVCQVECVPYRQTLTLEQPLGAEAVPDAAAAALLAGWEARVPHPAAELPGVTTAARFDATASGGPVLEVRVEGGGASPETADLFLEVHDRFDAGRPEAAAVPGGVRFTVPLARRDVTVPLPAESTFAWTVTGLEVGGEGVSLEARGLVGPAEGAAAGGAMPARTASGPGPATFLVAFAGGLALELTPGVLALLLWTGGELRRHREGGNPPSGRAWARTAAAAAFASCLALGALAVASGGRLVWGSQFEHPGLVAALAVLLLLLSLHLWGLVEGPRRRWWTFAGAGVAAALLALLWDLPGLGGALNAGFGAGALPGLGVAAALGAGLALPYLALPAVARRLPARRPGGPGREVLGFLPAGGLVWGLYLLAGRLDSAALAFVELALLALALCAWLRQRSARGMMRLALAVGVALAGAAAIVLAGG